MYLLLGESFFWNEMSQNQKKNKKRARRIEL